MERLKKYAVLLLSVLLFGAGYLPALADDDDFNPENPSDPNVIDYCWITVAADPAEGVYVSTEVTKCQVGHGEVYISSSANNTSEYTYEFKYWTLNGQIYSYNESFWYTPQKGKQNFIAHYEKKDVVFEPDSPDDPSTSSAKRSYYLYLTSNPSGSCSFSINSGDKHKEESWIYLSVSYDYQNYRFVGWKENGSIISSSEYYEFQMPGRAMTLEACLEELPFDPESPFDPSSSSQQQTSNRKFINLTIGNTSNQEVDKTRIVINASKTLGYDTGTDNAKTLSSTASYQIYTLDADKTKYSINERPVDNGIVPLGIIVNEAGNVVINATRFDCDAVLVDKTLNVQHKLSSGSYIFTSEAGTFEDRFEISISRDNPVPTITGDFNGDNIVNIVDITEAIKSLNTNDGKATKETINVIVNTILGKQ